MAARIEPAELVFRRAEAIPETAKRVVVALVVVELPVILRLPVKVEEALVKIMEEVVAETPADG